MADEQPITANPFPVPPEETAPKWWLEDPEPMGCWKPSLLELLVCTAIIGVLAGLISAQTSDPMQLDHNLLPNEQLDEMADGVTNSPDVILETLNYDQ